MLLDLDGTLLDLAFDNLFLARAGARGLGAAALDSTLEAARAELAPRFRACEGRSSGIASSIGAASSSWISRHSSRPKPQRIRWLPGAREFLQRVRALGKRLLLVTNAHPTALAIKDARTQVISHFDAGFSSHAFGAPKEHPRFWQELARVAPFDAARSLFVDDSLPVLRAARARRHRPDLRRAATGQLGGGSPACRSSRRSMRSPNCSRGISDAGAVPDGCARRRRPRAATARARAGRPRRQGRRGSVDRCRRAVRWPGCAFAAVPVAPR